MATNGFLSGPIRSTTGLIDPSPNNDMLQRFLAAMGSKPTTTPKSTTSSPDMLAIVKELRKSKDVVGERNRTSGPGGANSPFNNGFFKPMDMAFPELAAGYKPENLADINNRLFPGMSPQERAAAYQVGAPREPEAVRWHPNDQALGLVPGSEDRVGPDGLSTGRTLYSPYAAGGVRGSSTFETPQQPIGFRELGTNPSPEAIRATLANPQQQAAISPQIVNQVGAAPQSNAQSASPLGAPQPGGGMPGIPQAPAGAMELFRILSGLLGR